MLLAKFNGKQALSNIYSVKFSGLKNLSQYTETKKNISLAIKCLVNCLKPTKLLYYKSCHRGVVMELGYPCCISLQG